MTKQELDNIFSSKGCVIVSRSTQYFEKSENGLYVTTEYNFLRPIKVLKEWYEYSITFIACYEYFKDSKTSNISGENLRIDYPQECCSKLDDMLKYNIVKRLPQKVIKAITKELEFKIQTINYAIEQFNNMCK